MLGRECQTVVPLSWTKLQDDIASHQLIGDRADVADEDLYCCIEEACMAQVL